VLALIFSLSYWENTAANGTIPGFGGRRVAMPRRLSTSVTTDVLRRLVSNCAERLRFVAPTRKVKNQ
jgi:hypothetical protein